MLIFKIHWKIKAVQWFKPSDKKNLNTNFENVQEGAQFFKMLLGRLQKVFLLFQSNHPSIYAY